MPSQVNLQEKRQLLERQSEHLDACHRLIGVREEQLAEASKELEESRRANTDLRHSLGQMQEDAEPSRWESEVWGSDSPNLLDCRIGVPSVLLWFSCPKM